MPTVTGKDFSYGRICRAATAGRSGRITIHYHVGDILDIHHYPEPAIKLMDGERANQN